MFPLSRTPFGWMVAPLDLSSMFFLKGFYLFIFREEKGREGEKHQCVVASWVPSSGDLTCNPGMCPVWESNQQPFGSQAGTQSTEPHQPGPCFSFVIPVSFYFCSMLINFILWMRNWYIAFYILLSHPFTLLFQQSYFYSPGTYYFLFYCRYFS